MKHRNMIPAVLLGLLLCALPGCKGKEEEKSAALPTEYTVGGESVAAMVSLEGIQVSETPREETGGVTYTYEGLNGCAGIVEEYTAKLTEENGFSVVDDTLCAQDTPDFTAPEGEVRLAREAVAEGNVISLLLTWAEDVCTVTAEEQPGTLSTPQGMTLMECIDHIKSLAPAALGLPGSSMRDYLVYALDGTVLVDQKPCLQMNIYHNQTPEGTNDLVGMFLMTSDGQHIYRLDKATGTVEEVNR